MMLPDVRLPAALLDAEGIVPVDVEANIAQLERLYARVRDAWTSFGESEPDWSVSTHDQFCAARISGSLAEFEQTGERDAARFDLWLRRNGVSLPPEAVCLDFGCGTGRVAHALATRFARVVAVDASRPHLEIAKRRVPGEIEWRLLERLIDVERLPEVDAVFSLIVLQHSPPPLMLHLFRALLRALRPGGAAYIQCPVFRSGYSFHLDQYLASPPAPGVMEMHFTPQRHLFAAARQQGCCPLEVLPDPYTGDPDVISCTFLFRKEI